MEVLDKDTIREKLHNTICKVTFTKVNGEERIMYCTLNEGMIPAETSTSEVARTKKENPEVQAVYDVKAPGWRSFRWDSLKDFTSEINV